MASSDSLILVFEHIEKNRANFLARLIDYVRHPSISAENIGIAEVGALLVKMLTEIGLDTKLVATEGHPMVVARWEKAPGKPTVLLYGHYDVQPPDPLDKWLSPPFEPTIRDGRLYARGVGDNKGQHFAQILAIESHLKVHNELPCNVILLLEGEEEIGSPHIAISCASTKMRSRPILPSLPMALVTRAGRPPSSSVRAEWFPSNCAAATQAATCIRAISVAWCRTQYGR
jgi:acetylornithine deacetylase/succinyl-diaminopimelate desuccinylase-like protein